MNIQIKDNSPLFFIKDFLIGLFDFVMRIVMSIPFHAVRIAYLRLFIGHLGKNVSISRNVEIRCPKEIFIGDNVVINKNCLLDGRGASLYIENDVDIAQDTYIWTLQHDYNDEKHSGKGATVLICDHAWIGARSNILPGVTIGRGAVVGTCSVVTKDVPELKVVAGIPARVIGTRKNSLSYKLSHRLWFE